MSTLYKLTLLVAIASGSELNPPCALSKPLLTLSSKHKSNIYSKSSEPDQNADDGLLQVSAVVEMRDN